VHRGCRLEGGEVHFCNPAGGWNYWYVRDPTLVVGNNIIETAAVGSWKLRERFAVRPIIKRIMENGNARWVAMPLPSPRHLPEDPRLEGGDVLLNGREIYVGILKGGFPAATATTPRLQGHACAWFRYLGYLCEPSVQIPFGSRLLEYCDWAKQQRGLSDSSIYYFRGTIRQFLRWYGPIGRQLSSVHASDIEAYLAFGSSRRWARVTIHNVVAALRAFFRYGAQEGWCPRHLAETMQGPRIYAQERLPAGPTWADVERLFAGLDVNRLVAARLEPLNVQCAHHGPHSLRHACAARLVAQGLSLKEIGDHLGHRSTSATSVYAKVDLLGLREVAAFDLGELS
jgi:site-specific recombinase XerD